MMTKTAKAAIDRSESHDEIVTIDYDADAFAALKAASSDYASADGVTEFWRNDPDSETAMTWRVHMRDEDPAVAALRKSVTDLTFHVPPACQGQIVEYAYACDADHVYEKITDRSDRSVKFIAYEHAEGDEPFEPWNHEPNFGDEVARFSRS
jgi:hypothetical protein